MPCGTRFFARWRGRKLSKLAPHALLGSPASLAIDKDAKDAASALERHAVSRKPTACQERIGLGVRALVMIAALSGGSGCAPSRVSATAPQGNGPSAERSRLPAPSAESAAREPSAARAQKGLAAAVPGERWRSGYGLVELQPDAPPTLGAGSRSTALPSAELRLGGERVQAVRELAGHSAAAAAGAIVLYFLPDAQDAAATRRALARIATDPQVLRVEPDRIRRAAAVPRDPLWPQQWNLPLIRLPQAWELSQGSADVVVAFLDTGVVFGHPDLEARLVAGYDFVSTVDSADDGDTTRDADPADTGTVETSRLHGLHVAGTIGALTNNDLGIAGVDQKCRLLPVRVLGVNGGDGIDSDIADAVRWASGAQVGGLPLAAQPAQILNLSFGGPGISFTLQRAIDDAQSRGVSVIAAAGNGGADAATYSPAGLDGVIAVGAVGPDGRRASYSNFGPRVDLLAPGGGAPELGEPPDMLAADLAGGAADGILSTYRDDGIAEASRPPFTYGLLAGTSQAAPHVSGAAALVRAILPGVGPRTLAMLLRESADVRYRCPTDAVGGCGAGLLDVEALLRLAGEQRRCGCSGDEYCLDGSCVVPQDVHPSIFDRPVIHGGWCAISGPGAVGGGSLPVGLLAALVLAALRRRRYLQVG